MKKELWKSLSEKYITPHKEDLKPLKSYEADKFKEIIAKRKKYDQILRAEKIWKIEIKCKELK